MDVIITVEVTLKDPKPDQIRAVIQSGAQLIRENIHHTRDTSFTIREYPETET